MVITFVAWVARTVGAKKLGYPISHDKRDQHATWISTGDILVRIRPEALIPDRNVLGRLLYVLQETMFLPFTA